MYALVVIFMMHGKIGMMPMTAWPDEDTCNTIKTKALPTILYKSHIPAARIKGIDCLKVHVVGVKEDKGA